MEATPNAGPVSVARRNQYGDANRPSEKQDRYIRSLLRQAGLPVDETIAQYEANAQYTKRNVSSIIDQLKEIVASRPAPAPTSRPAVRTNQYPGRCGNCGAQVAEQTGRIERNSAGKWITFHLDGQCPPRQTVSTTHGDVSVSAGSLEGMHRLDEVIYKVQVAHHGSGNEYAKKLIVSGSDDEGWSGRFEYAPGAIRMLSQDTKLSLDEAKHFGHLYGFCCVCAAILTDETSIANGIGPICGGRF